jgi:cytochrome c biogenesis protein CcmG/thiol:disulfide interchange protein DsbE
MAEPSAAPRRGPLRHAGRAIAILVAVAFVALLAYGLASKKADTSIDDALKSGDDIAAPGFALPVLERGDLPPALARRLAPALADGKLSLSELRGTPVVVNFWASWCVPCRDEAPALESVWRADASRRGVLFVGLNMQDLTDDARRFARDEGMSYLTVRDRGNGVSRDYGVTGVPETFFVSGSGRVVGHVIGAASRPALRAGIASALAGRVRSAQRGGAQGATERSAPPARRPGAGSGAAD